MSARHDFARGGAGRVRHLFDPDRFLLAQLDLNEPIVVAAARRVRARLKSPHFSPAEYLDRLLVVGLVQTVARLQAHIEVI